MDGNIVLIIWMYSQYTQYCVQCHLWVGMGWCTGRCTENLFAEKQQVRDIITPAYLSSSNMLDRGEQGGCRRCLNYHQPDLGLFTNTVSPVLARSSSSFLVFSGLAVTVL